MGAWGTGLYADDTACDVRDDYVRLPIYETLHLPLVLLGYRELEQSIEPLFCIFPTPIDPASKFSTDALGGTPLGLASGSGPQSVFGAFPSDERKNPYSISRPLEWPGTWHCLPFRHRPPYTASAAWSAARPQRGACCRTADAPWQARQEQRLFRVRYFPYPLLCSAGHSIWSIR